MKWGAVFRGSLGFAFMLSACGESPSGRVPHGPWIDDPIESLPPRVELQGRWSESPAYQVREMGGSRMISLQVKSQTRMKPDVPRLAYALQPEKRSGMRWVKPEPNGCEISQFDVRKSNADDLTLDLQIWGWDIKDDERCERLLEVAHKTGLQVELYNVGVRRSENVATLTLTLTP